MDLESQDTSDRGTNRATDGIENTADRFTTRSRPEALVNAGRGAFNALAGAGGALRDAAVSAAGTNLVEAGANLVWAVAAPESRAGAADETVSQTEGARFSARQNFGVNTNDLDSTLAAWIRREAESARSENPDWELIILPVGIGGSVMARIRNASIDRYLLPITTNHAGGFPNLQLAIEAAQKHLAAGQRAEKIENSKKIKFVFLLHDLMQTRRMKVHRINVHHTLLSDQVELHFIAGGISETPRDRVDIRSTMQHADGMEDPLLFASRLSQTNFRNIAFAGPKIIFGFRQWREAIFRRSGVPAVVSAAFEGAAVAVNHGLITAAAAKLHMVAAGGCMVTGYVGISIFATFGATPGVLWTLNDLYSMTVWESTEEIRELFAMCAVARRAGVV